MSGFDLCGAIFWVRSLLRHVGGSFLMARVMWALRGSYPTIQETDGFIEFKKLYLYQF
jgi:hypothetical protein